MMSRKQNRKKTDDSTKSQIKSASSQEDQQPSPKRERVGR